MYVFINAVLAKIDQITIRDCERGMKSACVEVQRLNLN